MSRHFTRLLTAIVIIWVTTIHGNSPRVAAAEQSSGDSSGSLAGTKWRGTNKGERDSASVTANVRSHKDGQLVLVTHEENGMGHEWTFAVKGSRIALTSFRQTAGRPMRTYREERAEGTISDEQISFSYSFLWSGPQRKNVPARGAVQLRRE
jgi:hypothetical protein